MKTLTLSVPTVGLTTGYGASWRPTTAPSGIFAPVAGAFAASAVPAVECAAGTTHVAAAAAVAGLARVADLAALPFGTAGIAATTFVATQVMAVAGNQQVAVAPKQAKSPVPNNSMRKNASPHGNRAGAPPS